MDAFLDIYIKLIIAVISFIAPLILYLLGVFSEGVALLRSIAKEEEEQIKKLLHIQVTQAGTNFDAALVEKSNKALQQNKEDNKKQLNLLNPKRQIKRIYFSLAMSLGLIMADMIVRDRYFNLYNHSVSVILILISLFCFVASLIILKQIAWAVIGTKELLDKKKLLDKQAVPIESQNNH